MGNKNWWVRQQKINGAKKRLLKLYPNLPDRTGIYILTREDENGFKYSYIGQTHSKGGILQRMAEHLLGYQHIDRSLKAHKFIGEAEYGWELDWFECFESELDGYEKEYILKYANMGYQMRNHTIGSQHKGKAGLGENKPPKGYFDGVAYGYKKAIREVKEYFDKYLDFEITRTKEAYRKPKNKAEVGKVLFKDIYIKKYNEFKDLLIGEENND